MRKERGEGGTGREGGRRGERELQEGKERGEGATGREGEKERGEGGTGRE